MKRTSRKTAPRGEQALGILQLILLLISAVLISALLSQIIPKVSTPLVQIAIGVVIALVGGGLAEDLEIPAELFLVLFIAPLLFDEAKSIDRVGFWKNRSMILSLAIGLVVAITLSVGFALNFIVPSLPLAAAFALGAALGPTDAVAVSSMSSVAALSDKQKSILSGEALINDASGIVAFQFSIAAATTGTFSALEAGTTFCIEFFGGIGIGLLIGLACNAFLSFIQDRGFETETFSVLFDLALPFVVYLFGDSIHVSGVLAVVACGIIFQLSPRNASGPTTSKVSIISASTWHVLTFALNGIVFVLLGVMLPGGMVGYVDGVSYINWALLGIAEAVAIVLIGVRFVWVLLMERVFGSAKKIDKELLRHCLVLTLSGAKGAITLSIAMTIPLTVTGRSDMIFFASCIIVTTLLLANFLIPVLAPADEASAEEKLEKEHKAYLAILRTVVEKMTAEMAEQTGPAVIATLGVIEEYNSRIEDIKEEHDIEDEDEHLVDLRLKAIDWQRERAVELRSADGYDRDIVGEYLADLGEIADKLRQRSDLVWMLGGKFRKFKVFGRTVSRIVGLKKIRTSEDMEKKRKVQLECRLYALDKLAEEMEKDAYSTEDLAKIVAEYQQAVTFIRKQSLSMSQVLRVDDMKDNSRMTAYRYEMAAVNDAYASGDIDRAMAAKFRRKVAMMQLDVSGDL